MDDFFTVLVNDSDRVVMAHALRNHQPIDAVGGEIFHVAIEKAGAAAGEHAVAIANHGAHSRARPGNSVLANAGRNWAQVRMRVWIRWARLQLVREWKLLHGDFVLIRMASPSAIHQRECFILL